MYGLRKDGKNSNAKLLFFDNFVLGGSIGAIVGKLKNLTATVEGTAVDPNDVNEGVATLDFIPQVTLFIGLRF